jgi:hypothetical protein
LKEAGGNETWAGEAIKAAIASLQIIPLACKLLSCLSACPILKEGLFNEDLLIKTKLR